MQYLLKAPTDSAGISAVIGQSTSLPISVAAPVSFCQRYDWSAVSCTDTCAVPGGMRNYVKLQASYAWNPMVGLVPESLLRDTLTVRTQ